MPAGSPAASAGRSCETHLSQVQLEAAVSSLSSVLMGWRDGVGEQLFLKLLPDFPREFTG